MKTYDRKLIKGWNDLVGLENERFILEINTDMGCGWVRRKCDYASVAYLSTHTFYGSRYEYSTKMLNYFGFNVEIDNWDKGVSDMVCKLCPARKHCWDKGNCESCEFGKAYNGLFEKNKRLKAKNEKLEKENKELNKRIDALLHPEF